MTLTNEPLGPNQQLQMASRQPARLQLLILKGRETWVTFNCSVCGQPIVPECMIVYAKRGR